MEKRFRAWDRYNKKMIELGTIEDIAMRHRAGHDDDWANYDIMYYTGKKDKNSKEIYDGDIAKFTLVRMSEQEPEYKNQKGVVEIKECYTLLGGAYMGWCVDIEVIGNIYENPELLDKL